ncbi:MAG TPA: ATP-binding protein, partial [Anaerolineales bacterium]|nr:ATP-binding protein [Anaerolineales bacterium]
DLFLPPEEMNDVQRALKQAAGGQFPVHFESTWVTQRREKRLIMWSNRALHNTRGQVEYLIATGIDITDRKIAEAQVQAAQTHLAQAARLATIGEMASGVAHQINNPLTTIIADTQLLMRTLPGDHPGRESAEAIQTAGWRLQEVVQRLVEFSRPATQDYETVDVNATIHNAIQLVGAHITASGATINAQLNAALPKLRGIPRQLEDLWVNLLLLARDAVTANESGAIRVCSRAGDNNRLVIEVIDDGKPIPAEELPTIFEPNFIGPTSGRGAGLELSICREIVRQHGGEISAELSPKNETVIRVILPDENQPNPAAPVTTAASPNHTYPTEREVKYDN